MDSSHRWLLVRALAIDVRLSRLPTFYSLAESTFAEADMLFVCLV